MKKWETKANLSESTARCVLTDRVLCAEKFVLGSGQMRDREVHLWQVDLADAHWDTFSEVLSLDEKARAGEFRTSKLRQYYRRCRSAVRVLLARYSGEIAAGIQFHYGEFGKPEMEHGRWHFNVSHSHNLALVAISLSVVGIDLERMLPLSVDVGMVNIICHPAELTSFRCLTLNERHALFYRLLTRKEAYCKAVGIGLQRPLSDLCFAELSSSTGLEVSDEKNDSLTTFFVYEICSLIDYAVSVCLPFSDAQISLFSLEPDSF
jgi:4'-phosphopantetheinyl transferase